MAGRWRTWLQSARFSLPRHGTATTHVPFSKWRDAWILSLWLCKGVHEPRSTELACVGASIHSVLRLCGCPHVVAPIHWGSTPHRHTLSRCGTLRQHRSPSSHEGRSTFSTCDSPPGCLDPLLAAHQAQLLCSCSAQPPRQLRLATAVLSCSSIFTRLQNGSFCGVLHGIKVCRAGRRARFLVSLRHEPKEEGKTGALRAALSTTSRKCAQVSASGRTSVSSAGVHMLVSVGRWWTCRPVLCKLIAGSRPRSRPLARAEPPVYRLGPLEVFPLVHAHSPPRLVRRDRCFRSHQQLVSFV